MKFTVTGTDHDGTYDMVQDNATFAEARAIEKITGHTFQALMKDPELQNSLSAIQAVLWVSMKREHPTLTFDDLDDFPMDAVRMVEEEEPEAGPLAAVPTVGDAVSKVETTSPLSA